MDLPSNRECGHGCVVVGVGVGMGVCGLVCGGVCVSLGSAKITYMGDRVGSIDMHSIVEEYQWLVERFRLATLVATPSTLQMGNKQHCKCDRV
jgi:hypothetical protein